jgi:hypothetical protein
MEATADDSGKNQPACQLKKRSHLPSEKRNREPGKTVLSYCVGERADLA